MKVFAVLLLAVFCFASTGAFAQGKQKFNWNKVVGVSVSYRLCPGETKNPVEEYTITDPAEVREIVSAFRTKPDRRIYGCIPTYNIFLKDSAGVVLKGWGGMFGISLWGGPNETYWFSDKALALLKKNAQICK